jgi:hypothetical protein
MSYPPNVDALPMLIEGVHDAVGADPQRSKSTEFGSQRLAGYWILTETVEPCGNGVAIRRRQSNQIAPSAL